MRAAVIEHIDIVIGAQQGIHGHGDGPYFYSAEESRGKLGRIEQQECDALFHVNTQVEQPVPGTVAQFRDLRIRISLSLVKNRGFCASSLRQVAFQKAVAR